MSQNGSLPPEDDFARALLRSAELDEPSHSAYSKVAAALGVSTAVGLGASLPAPAALAAASSGLARWSSSLGGKVALLGISGALLVGAGSVLLRQRLAGTEASGRAVLGSGSPQVGSRLAAERPPPRALGATGSRAISGPNPARDPSAPAPAGAAAAVEAAPPGIVMPTMDADAEAALANPRAGRAAGHGAGAAVGHPVSTAGVAGSSLSEQVQSLDRARVALAAGDPSAALVEIARYRKAWPEGVFLTEASVLEIEALAKRGQRSLAAARAQAFVTAHPDSPQVERLRLLIAAPAAERP